MQIKQRFFLTIPLPAFGTFVGAVEAVVEATVVVVLVVVVVVKVVVVVVLVDVVVVRPSDLNSILNPL